MKLHAKWRRFITPGAVLAGFLVVGLVSWSALGCTSIPVTPGASADGSAMTTHQDDSGTDTFHVKMVPSADWPAESMRPVLRHTDYGPYYQLSEPIFSPGEIPQVRHTFAYTNSSYSFQNEKQVGIGETTIGGRSELENPKGWFDVVELQRVALERASTAREAIRVMGSLAEEFGYAITGECLTVIDPKEAWQFEIWGPGPLWDPGSGKAGAVWVAQRIPDGEVGVSANRSRIGAVNLGDQDHFMASPNLFSLAEEMNWWKADSGKEFKVYETYGYKAYPVGSARREWRVLSTLAPSLNLSPWDERYPFSVKPDKPVTFQDIMKLERDHYEGTEFDTRVGMAAGPFGNPHRNSVARQSYPANSGGWERTICINNTNYATIVTARGFLPDWIGGMTWFVYDSPCLSCYIPIYCGATALPKSFDTGMRGGSYDVFSRESAWWAFNFVSNWAELKRSVIEKDILAVRDPIEAEFFAMQPVVEETAATLYEKNPELARQFISTYTFNAANKVAEAYGNLARKLVGRYADGRRYGDDTFVLDTVGYPDWWLKAVEFGQSTIRPEAK